MQNASVFLCYARKDRNRVEKLYQELKSIGFYPWMDVIDILPGEDWKNVLKRTIRDASFFIVCLSDDSVSRRGVIQEEIGEALNAWQQKLDTDIYLIPVRLESCTVPESLSRFQWVDLFEKGGFDCLVNALKEGMRRLGRIPPDQKQMEVHLVVSISKEDIEFLLNAWRQAFWDYREHIGIGDSFAVENDRLEKNIIKLREDILRCNPTTPQKIRSFLKAYGVLSAKHEDIISRLEKDIDGDYFDYLHY